MSFLIVIIYSANCFIYLSECIHLTSTRSSDQLINHRSTNHSTGRTYNSSSSLISSPGKTSLNDPSVNYSPSESIVLNAIKPFQNRTRNGRSLIKKLLNLVDGCNNNNQGCSGGCTKGCCSNPLGSLFGFTIGSSDCCTAQQQFVDDGLEPDYRHRNHQMKRKQYQAASFNSQKLHTTKNDQLTKVRKKHYSKLKDGEKVVQRWPGDQKNGIESDKVENDLKQANEQAYLVDRGDQQKLSLFNANDYISNVLNAHSKAVNEMQPQLPSQSYDSYKPLRPLSKRQLSTTTMAYVDKRSYEYPSITDEQTTDDEFYLVEKSPIDWKRV